MPTPSSNSPQPPDDLTSRPKARTPVSRLRPLATVASALLCLTLAWTQLTFEQVVRREDQLRAFCAEQPLVAFTVAFLIYTAATGLSLPAAAGLTLATAWLFGFWPALALVSFASTSGASLAFLASRWLLGQRLQELYGTRIQQLQQALERDGVQYLLMLRLMPLMPFFLVNLLMGLTRMRLRTFWWVSQLGMLPGTAVFVAAGAAAPTLRQIATEGAAGIMKPSVMLAFALLGGMPLIVKLVARRFVRT
ncbi:MAG: TVP38/TMEM64 family protein [Planctomycetota bacterium]